MSVHMKRLMSHKNILLLQGKMGTFFCRFATFLMEQGKYVHKINFNAGDAFFYCHKHAVDNYRGCLEDFDKFLAQIIKQHHIEAIVCFNDCRPYHLIAKTLCQTHQLAFFVFEEGYLRPDYITLEEHGINGYSRLDPMLINQLQNANDQPKYTANRFWRMCVASMVYYLMVFLWQWRYPHYEHYRGLTIGQEIMAWLIYPLRKLYWYYPDLALQKKLVDEGSFYLVSLQVHNDSQITHHSDYADVKDFITEVLTSFAKHAPQGTKLVFKHHPLDRGHRNYRGFIKQLSQTLGVAGRTFYGCDMHLPSLIKASIGMITVNSTTGLQSIYHQKPTKVMGRALYDIKGLTDQQSLDKFWANPMPPNRGFYLKFREYLIEQTQLNGSFYGTSPWVIAYRQD
ncbi:capsule biosynthesis protein [Moraxella sp. VT-16-12]|uniref:capsule biosynthesis protein n=1 Tax=Moraxella sp. VT-16-12 TaxID=2014877 RepID=UPI000B7EC7DF|nr:capsular biosynthesis protein [Moraxella sp. VT-16-12]TWV82402.1 capsular biosynthesis protein [Moraxella sp. VT-16-12]